MVDDIEGGADLIDDVTNGNGSRSRSPAGPATAAAQHSSVQDKFAGEANRCVDSFVQIAIANGFVKFPFVFETACAAAVAINGGSRLVVDAMSELHSQVQLMSSDAKLSSEEVLK